jgi:hypothetical protein
VKYLLFKYSTANYPPPLTPPPNHPLHYHHLPTINETTLNPITHLPHETTLNPITQCHSGRTISNSTSLSIVKDWETTTKEATAYSVLSNYKIPSCQLAPIYAKNLRLPLITNQTLFPGTNFSSKPPPPKKGSVKAHSRKDN